MNKIQFLLIILLTCYMISACSANPNASQLYKQETPLEAEIILPDLLEPTKAVTIKVNLTQNGDAVENPQYVHLKMWKQDGTVTYGMTEASNDGNGQFSLNMDFESEGLYYIQVHASNNDSIITPTKLLIVGELSESDKQALKSNAPIIGGESGAHH
ncbi:FixH family protein [Lysinibacillus louembei]|uniref:FixH family protein n=1 Tax=Lysinibacillus louembei TaxID=1470088 RepID=A0ABZ0RRR1_9BACI|nr:FixH family protein [Lysinibacillus louembei]WPK10918.1 FixH family protein [Lysinibacillus louembei]